MTLLRFLRENAPWLGAGFLLTFASSFGQTFFISVFSADIRQAFGLTSGQWGGIFTFATMASAAVMVFVGGLTDRFRVRHIGVGALLLLSVAALLMAQITAFWALLLVIFLLRLAGQGMMNQAAMVAMARWFVASRGRAVSVARLGVATGEAVLPVGFVVLMAVLDWRLLWLVAGAALLLLTPLLYRLLRRERTPQSFVTAPGSLGLGGRSWTRRQVFRHWLFWALVPAMLGPSAWVTAFFFHQGHFAQIKGWSHLELVALFPSFTAAGVAFMLASGWAVDRFGSARLVAVYVLPLTFAFWLLATAETPATMLPGLVLMGASVGTGTTINATFWAEYYGTRNLGKIRAMITAIMVLGSALGPGITGLLIDLGVDFPQQSRGLAFYFLIAGAIAAVGALKAQQAWASQALVVGGGKAEGDIS